MTNINKKLLTLEEVSKKLNLKESWIRSAILNRSIPHLKIGRLIRFDEEQLTIWIKSKQITGRL